MEKQRGIYFNRDFLRAVLFVSLLCFFVLIVPPLGVGAIPFMPLFAIYCYAKHGRQKGFTVVVASLSLAFVFLALLGAFAGLPLVAAMALAGVIIAECLQKKYSIEKTILHAVAALFLLEAALISYQAFITSETPWHLVQTNLTRQLKISVDFYGNLPIAKEQAELVKGNIPAIAAALTMILPALSLVALMFMVWVNLLVARPLLHRYGLPGPDFGDLSTWKAPDKMVWYLIGAGVMILMSEGGTGIIGWNMLIVICAVYMFAGLAIVSYFLKKSPFPAGFRYLIYFLIFAQQIVTLLVTAVGLFDLWIDFRKLNKTVGDPVV
ncbi:MAG: DUF2232 domain-containing protein [Syntrophales bacterium]